MRMTNGYNSVSTSRPYVVTHEYIPADGSALLLGDRVSFFFKNILLFVESCTKMSIPAAFPCISLILRVNLLVSASFHASISLEFSPTSSIFPILIVELA